MKKHCKKCNRFVDIQDLTEYNGEFYCDECVSICRGCGDVFLRESLTHIDDYGDYCEDCLEEDFIRCSDCGEIISNESSYFVDSIQEYVCSNCWSDHYASCGNCGYSAHTDDLIWDDDINDYSCPDCYNEEHNSRTYPYHSGLGRGNNSYGYRYRVGVELEREDEDFLDKLDKDDFLNKYGWVIERDASLGDDGFEAISPILPLKIGSLEKELSKKDLKELTRADYSHSCGGHITISDRKRTPDEIIDDIAGYLPILYAMFPHRTPNDYCYVLNKDGYKTRGGHIALNKRGDYKGDGLEIRLFDAPKDEKDLINRFRFVLYILQHKARTIEQGLEELSDSDKLGKIVKYHLNTYNMSYENFYRDIERFSDEVEKVVVRPESLRKVANKLN